MKKNENLSAELLKKFKTLVIVLIGITVLSSCLKTYVDPRIENSAHTIFVNVIPDNTTYNVYIDNARATNQPFAFSFALPPIYVSAGSKTIEYRLNNSSQVVITDTVVFKPKNYYTIFSTRTTDPELVVIEDVPANLTDPPTGKAKVRFINMSPGSPNIDLFVDKGATLFTNIAYKTTTEFLVVNSSFYDLNFRATGTTGVKFTKRIAIDPDRLYTIFALGVWNPLPEDAPLDLGLLDAR